MEIITEKSNIFCEKYFSNIKKYKNIILKLFNNLIIF